MSVTYTNYLKLDELLALQRPLSPGPEHDELLFITIHQVYELWFKELLHELDYLSTRFIAGDTPRAQHTLKRILTVLKVLVSQIDVLETMTPLEFLSFRDRLESGSGFQSRQFRELEMALGRRNRGAVEHYAADSTDRARLEARFTAPTIWDAFLRYIARMGHEVPASALARDVRQPIGASEEIQRVLLHVYHHDAAAAGVCERLVDLDEGMQEWRYRHVKMVQRTIGTRRGTGGSMGAEYLLTTLNQPAFPDLWAIRTSL